MNELVSIITPTYNCGSFIAKTIESVLSQTYQNWEMIIVDDCSRDKTKEVVEPYLKKDSRIKYYYNEHNSGAALTRNRALREAQGRWIAFLDSDDLWLPEKLEKQISFMVQNQYAFSYHEYTEISEEDENLGVYVSGIRKVSKWEMYACCWPGCLSVMYDKKRIGLVQIEDIRKNNDTAMWLKVVENVPCYLLKENLACYRRRKGSITPVSTWGKVKAHYPIFRVAQKMNPFSSWFWTILNIAGNLYKKLFYVRTFKV